MGRRERCWRSCVGVKRLRNHLIAAAIGIGILGLGDGPQALAGIPEPSALYYGTVTIDGVLQSVGANVVVTNGPNQLASYVLGTDGAAEDQSGNALYVLQVPLENLIDQSTANLLAARLNDELVFSVNGVPFDTTRIVKERGEVVQINLSVTGGPVGECVAEGNECFTDGNPCTEHRCDASLECVQINLTSACDDGLYCNGTDQCAGGSCSVHSGDPCTGGAECLDTCNEALDGCVAVSGTLCTSDGNPCTTNECDGAGTCIAVNNVASCDDGDYCNGTDQCSGGMCSVHAGNPCPGDCDEQAGRCIGCIDLSLPSEVSCRANDECSVPVDVDTMTNEVASISAALTSAVSFSCDAGCTSGAAAANASCIADTSTCAFNVVDLSPPITGFGDGELARLNITCLEDAIGEMCVTGLSASGTDGVTVLPVCPAQCATLDCGTCIPGDCNVSGTLDAGDPICGVLCLIGSADEAADCSCAADCNCVGGVDAGDPICTVLRLIGPLETDPCIRGRQLKVGETEPSLVKTKIRTSRRVDAKRPRSTIILRGRDAGTVAAVRLVFASDTGSIRRIRLARRLRKAGFEIQLNKSPSFATALITAPYSYPIESMDKGRMLHIRLSENGPGALSIARREYGSTEGMPIHVR